MASKELITKIVLSGRVDGSLSKAFKKLSDYSDTYLHKLKKIGDTATKAFKIVGAAVAAAGVATAKAAIDFESAFAGVQKTVDETDTTSYEDLSAGIRKMATEMPAAATEIAAVAEAAGQLGIKADDVLSFTKTMINLGETTNLSSDEAATAIAKMFNVTGTSMELVDEFGATLVALGNNAATTESDILNMATRIASSGSQIGMTEQQILALATSLSSVGLEAEGGGTAISTVMSNIDKAVALNDETLTTWASTAGMSVSKFKTLWETDAYGALQKIISGMSDTKAEGGNLNVLLDELGITGIRTSDTMKRLSNASKLMGDMTSLANEAWAENSALTEEAQKRYATTASRIEVLRNKVNDVMITVGNALLPVINKIIDKMDEINWDEVAAKIVDKVQWVIDNFDKIKVALTILAAAFATFKIASFINTIAGAAKEIKILLTVMGKTTGITNFIQYVKNLNTVMGMTKFQSFITAFKSISIVQKISTAAQWLFNASLYGCPIVWIIAAVLALIAIIVLLVKHWDKVKEAAVKCWDGIKNAVAVVGEWLKNFFTVTIPNAFNAFVEKCRNVINTIVTFFSQLPSKIWTWLVSMVQKIAAWGLSIVAKAKEIGSNFLNSIVNFFKQLPYKIGYCIGYAIGKVFMFGKQLWTFATTEIPKFIGKVIEWFKQLPSRIWTWLVNTVTKIGQWGTQMYNKAKAAAVNAINAVVNFFKTLPSKVWNWLVNTVTKIAQWGVNMYAKMKSATLKAINAVITFFKQLPSKVWTWLVNTVQKVASWGSQRVAKAKKAATDTFNAIVNKIKEIPKKMLEIGKNIVQGLWNGIKNAKDWLIDKVKNFASGILDGIKDACGINSPSKITTGFGVFIAKGLGIGIDKMRAFVGKSVDKVSNIATNGFGKIAPVISPVIGAVKGKIQKFATGGTVSRPQTAIVGDVPETIVPHGNTPRNRALLSEAAAGVGASIGGTYSFSITFAPVISGGNAEENRKMIQEEEEDFKRRMDAYFEEKVRLAF